MPGRADRRAHLSFPSPPNGTPHRGGCLSTWPRTNTCSPNRLSSVKPAVFRRHRQQCRLLPQNGQDRTTVPMATRLPGMGSDLAGVAVPSLTRVLGSVLPAEFGQLHVHLRKSRFFPPHPPPVHPRASRSPSPPHHQLAFFSIRLLRSPVSPHHPGSLCSPPLAT